MRRRDFISLIGGATVTWPLAARAQQPGKLPLIGVLVSASSPHPFADAFWRGLHALGYAEGQNIKVEFRYTDGRSDRAEEYAEELVQLRVDVIVAHYAVAVSAAMAATRTIPIVMAPHGAPLLLGVIDSLARPVETSQVYQSWTRRLAANGCSSSANSFRTSATLQFSLRPRPRAYSAHPS